MRLLNNAFGQVFRGYRENAGLTQKDLAAKMGGSLSAVKKLEHGDRIPTLRTLLSICKALNADPRVFVGEVVNRLAFLEGRERE